MLKARKSQGKCEVCWQQFKRDAVEVGTDSEHPRSIIKFQGRFYHRICWKERYKGRKLAQTKQAKGKKSL